MTFPVIGVTTTRRKTQFGMRLSSLAEAYVAALVQAETCPVLIPNLLQEDALDDLLACLDGVLFTGGGDMKTSLYQETDHPKVSEVEEERDRLELLILNRVVKDGKPFLGICRGLQLINVGLGGTLYADISDQVPGAAKHDYYPDWERDYLAHSVEVAAGSRLAGILGEGTVEVNSRHHQAIRELAPDVKVTAHSPDGLIEAIELPGHPYGIAVQWHPEWLTAHRPMRDLFASFAEAANRHKPSGGN